MKPMDIKVTPEELKEIIDCLCDNGWYITSIQFSGLDENSTEEVTMVGSNKEWEN